MAWLIACVCVALGWQRRRALERLSPPSPAELVRELVSDDVPDISRESSQRFAVAELNERLADVSFQLGLLPATYTALTRISLASGSALALLSFLGSSSGAPLQRAFGLGTAAAGGLLGAGTVLAFGRSAKNRSAEIREAWDRSSREAGKALGSALGS